MRLLLVCLLLCSISLHSSEEATPVPKKEPNYDGILLELAGVLKGGDIPALEKYVDGVKKSVHGIDFQIDHHLLRERRKKEDDDAFFLIVHSWSKWRNLESEHNSLGHSTDFIIDQIQKHNRMLHFYLKNASLPWPRHQLIVEAQYESDPNVYERAIGNYQINRKQQLATLKAAFKASPAQIQLPLEIIGEVWPFIFADYAASKDNLVFDKDYQSSTS